MWVLAKHLRTDPSELCFKHAKRRRARDQNSDALYKPRSKFSMSVEKRESKSNQLKRQILGRNKAFTIAITGLLAGVYAAVTISLGSISYGVLNLRLSNLLLAVVPLVGWPGVFGISLGVSLGNLASPFGPLDYIVSPLFSFVGLSCLKLLSKKTVLGGLTIYSFLLSLWVTYELQLVLHLPYFPTFYYILAGIALVSIGFAYPLYKALKLSKLVRRLEAVG
jgi:uncharacterized membrane protein